MSDVSRRIAAVEYARARCRPVEDFPANYDEILVQASRSSSEIYASFIDGLRALDSLDLRRLSDATRAAIYAEEPTVRVAAADSLSLAASNLIPPELDLYEGSFVASLAGHLAACGVGDLCTPDSFRMQEVCVRWGACEGRDVVEAITTLLGPSPATLAHVREHSERVVAAVRAGRP